ncbi:MAG: Rieske (2Fe-2S) iron-sulfur domain-containing protein [Cytophagaceae bacterium BCCC1]|jgi:Rieske Fe-S protein|nr:MAG: Rieske (2Fe-2S) iron-sulfur domain-containing protein [Cytophagaceae bacterium BCCC1]
MKRRDFFKAGCLTCLGGGAMLMTLQACSHAYFAQQVDLRENKLVIKKSEFVEIKKEVQSLRNVVVAKYEKLGFPIAVFRVAEDQYSAIYLECTHQGNEVRPHGNFLICEGHGSEFDNQGKVLQGPAEKALRTFNVTTDKDNIYINLA